MKDKTTAGVLALLLGGLGGHFFYLGNFMLGVICLFTFWSGIPFIIGIINGIQYLTMPQAQFDAKYNGGRSSVPAYAAPHAGGNVSDELAKLHDLKEKGALTEAEYNARKARLLS